MYTRDKLKDIKFGTVVAYPCGQEYIKSKVLRVVRAGNWQRVLYTVSRKRCLHNQSVRVTKRMIVRARRDNRMWGVGLRPPQAQLTEKHVVTPETFKHLCEWIFSTDFLEPLKASEQTTERGHCFAVKEAATRTFVRCVSYVFEKYRYVFPYTTPLPTGIKPMPIKRQ